MSRTAMRQFYMQLLRGKSQYKKPRRYQLIINCLFVCSLVAVLIATVIAVFDKDVANNTVIYSATIFTSILITLWWLSRSGRHTASILACTICSVLALATIGLQHSFSMPPAELAAIVVISFATLLLELRLTRAELRAERDMLEQRVIERTEALEAEQLRRTLEMQRFAEFGRLSAQLLHDVANPLTVASLHLEQADNRTSTAIREARRSLRQLEQYVQSARYQLQQTSQPRTFHVQKELRQLMLILKPMAQKSNVRIVLSRTKIQMLNGDPVRFHQIMANVIANAIDACVAQPSNKQHTVTITVDRIARYVHITVHDTGKGITNLEVNKIFEPFYTTKQQSGRGLGIGLATVRRTLREEFHGTICAKSQPHSGTTFSMLLRAEQPLMTPEQVTTTEAPALTSVVTAL